MTIKRGPGRPRKYPVEDDAGDQPVAGVDESGEVVGKDEEFLSGEDDIAVGPFVVEEASEEVDAPVVPQGRAKSAYRVTATAKRGFWRIARHFTLEPQVILAESLTTKQIAELESTDPRYLAVEHIVEPPVEG